LRRNARSLIIIALIILITSLVLLNQKIEINNFERGSDAPLGLSLGLDLQGGSHLVYQSNLKDPITNTLVPVTKDQMESLVRTVERRINSSGLGEPIIQILGDDRLLIQLPGIKDPSRAKDLIGETARLEFKHRILNVQPELIKELTVKDVIAITPDILLQDGKLLSTQKSQNSGTETSELETYAALVIEFSDAGVEKFSKIAETIQSSYLTSLQANAAGKSYPPSQLLINIGENDPISITSGGNQILQYEDTNKFIFALPVSMNEGIVKQEIPAEDITTKTSSDFFVSFSNLPGFIDEEIGLSGDDLSNAYPSQHQGSGAPIVNIEFDKEGTKIFGELTSQIYAKQQESGIKDQIAIILDGDDLIAPVVNSPITAGTAIIQGPDFTLERVKDLSLLLESGRLPIPIQLIQERDVDAILGAQSLEKSVVAGIVGLTLVLLFMTLYYRIPGLIASIALIIYASIILSIFKLLPVTLTLSGVAAAILSIGMAVDANILIFERMKDELRSGRTLNTSINIGFNRAWPAIRDGNVSTLITCAILYWFSEQLGATIVQGFAVTLAIGVVISMFSAIMISRSLMRAIALTPLSKHISFFIPSGGGKLSKQLAQ